MIINKEVLVLAVVYKHTNKINGKVYIGWTHNENPKIRWHGGTNYMHHVYFGAAIKKYGWDGFDHEILFCGLSDEEVKKKEIELIALYDATNPNKGYNLTNGGDGSVGYKHTEKAKESMSKARKGKQRSVVCCQHIRDGLLQSEKHKKAVEARRGVKRSPEVCAKIKEGIRRYYETHDNPMKGKIGVISDEHRKRLSEIRKADMAQRIANGWVSPMKGRHLTQEHKDKISKANTGRHQTEETKQKISLAEKGKSHSEIWKQHIREAKNKK